LASHLSPPSFGVKAYEVGANNGLAAPDNIPPTSRLEPTGQPSSPSKFEPEEYRNAKKQLKRAVLEFYRGVEYLHNYRVRTRIITQQDRNSWLLDPELDWIPKSVEEV
jgi:hypothetical protein